MRLIEALGRRRLALAQAIVVGLVTVVVLARVFASGNAAGQNGWEMDLNQKPNSRAWELNSGADGQLWISDFEAGEIWQLNPATNVYTTYNLASGVSDGRPDANGNLWWVGYDDYNFGRLDLDSNVRTVWPLTGTVPGNVTGLDFDDQGRIWIPDLTRSDLYRFDPQSSEFCHFHLPNNSASNYIVSHDGYLWLADWKLPYIYRIDPAAGSYVQWFYAKASDPWGMTFDDNGDLWWAGLAGYQEVPSLMRLDTSSIFVTFYALPVDTGQPVMVDAWHNFIWFSDLEGRFGLFNPEEAVGTTLTASTVTGTLPLVKCYQDWQPLSTTGTSKSAASAEWTAGAYSTTAFAGGWQLYQLPQDTVDLGPWGIRAQQDGVWVVDQERQKLVHVPWQKLFIPLVTK